MKLQKALIVAIALLIFIALPKVSLANRYADNSDGTLTDTVTGLMWQKANDGKDGPLSEARSYCANLQLGGHQDWRVPRIDELETIVHYTRYDPALDPSFTINGIIVCAFLAWRGSSDRQGFAVLCSMRA